MNALVGLVGEEGEFGDVDPDEADAAAGGGEAAGVEADGVELARAEVRGDDGADGRDGGNFTGGLLVRNRIRFNGFARLLLWRRGALRAGGGASLALADGAEEKMADVAEAARILGLVVHLRSVSVPPCDWFDLFC